MNDTIRLQVLDYEILDENKFVVQPSTFEPSKDEQPIQHMLFTCKNKDVFGSKAFINTEKFNVTLKPMFQGGNALFIQSSIPKLLNGSNFYSVGRGGLKASIPKLENELKSVGVMCDVSGAKLSRVDLVKNAILDEPFTAYKPIFEALSLSRHKQRQYEGGFLYNNASRELSIYDKIKEMHHLNEDISNLPENVGRFELRLLKPRVIQNDLGVKTISELYSAYDFTKEYYKKQLSEKLFRFEPNNRIIHKREEVKKMLEEIQKKHTKGWLMRFFATYGYSAFMSGFNPEEFKVIIKEVAPNRVTANKQCKLIDSLNMDSTMSDTEKTSQKSFMRLYEELKNKLVA